MFMGIKKMYEHYEKDCLFCSKEFRNKTIRKHGRAFVVEDNYPVTKGHVLIILDEHKKDFFDLSFAERGTVMELLEITQRKLKEEDPTITGFNIGMNCGESAGQTVMHLPQPTQPNKKA